MTDNQKLEFYKMAFNAIFDKNLYLSAADRTATDMAVSFKARDLAIQLIKSADEMIEEQQIERFRFNDVTYGRIEEQEG